MGMDALDGGVLWSFWPHTAVCSKPMVLGLLFLSFFFDICGTADCHAVTKHPEFPSLQTLFAGGENLIYNDVAEMNLWMHTMYPCIHVYILRVTNTYIRTGYFYFAEFSLPLPTQLPKVTSVCVCCLCV
jgi:hypothetical protein